MKKYGLIGYPLGHSFSKNFFNEKFHSENIDAEYVNFEIPSIKELPSVLLANPDLVGLNVTIPYKEQVISYLDELDKDAAAIGAVNVIKIVRQKGKTRLIGYNSDVIGFTQSIEPLLEPQHKKALILGTGGASKAIAYGLKKLGLECKFVSRNLREEMLTYDQLTPEIMDVTHDQEVALAISDRIAIMDAQGHIRQIGTPYEIFEKPADLFIFKFMGIANFLAVKEANGKFVVGNGTQEVPWEAPQGKAAA